MSGRPAAPPQRRWRQRARQALARLHRPAIYTGNRIALLVGGEVYFPQLLAAIESARRSVHLETYIFADDRIGARVLEALTAAAARGVEVHLLVDGFGGGEHARRMRRELPPLGVQMRIYRPERWWRLDRKLLRRLHRKLAVIDERVAFVGGINIIDDYTEVPATRWPQVGPRFDFAVRCEGPIVGALALAARRLWWAVCLAQGAAAAVPLRRSALAQPRFADGVAASLLLRDNFANRHAFERAYRGELAQAQSEILIANAYFLPGRRFRAALRAAAARGARVRLLLQGRVEYAIQHLAQRAMYGDLLGAGIEIHEYLPSYLHAKVAVIDQRWATVGSSNIDPYSLLLAREANVAVHDEHFAAELRAVLVHAIEHDSRALRLDDYARRGLLARLADWCAYALVRLATAVLVRAPDY
jgi:cardiolipin synthase